MPDQVNKTPCCLGLLAHVDAGKTSLTEALLYESGARRSLGRVDHGDSFLDTQPLERERGITIFSKQAILETEHRRFTLVDTPGHADFSAEMERTLGILDCAVLVISGTDGVQAHTLTLWNLLERYHVPVILFVNKMDLPGTDRDALLGQLQSRLSPACVDFGTSPEEIAENAAMCDEALLETYLAYGTVTEGNLRGLLEHRKLFPCLFGSALRLQGVKELLTLLDRLAPEPVWGAEFAARVFKISRDPAGNRLTWLKVTGGALRVRQLLSYRNRKGELREEKINQLRAYSGEKFTAPESLSPGEIAAVTGLTETWAGQTLGAEPEGESPLLEPVMTYRVRLPGGVDPVTAFGKLRLLEEEDPQLHLLIQGDAIQVQIMGRVQLEVFRSLVKERFGLDITLEDRRIVYKETIENTVEGVGHYEPLRHYAEVHLLLEPGEPGSGLRFGTVCSLDILDGNYQNLILTHLAEKAHRGVLTGAPITDMRITLLVGKAHLKHTEGGDFRQATYRAVRQGLMQAKCKLLEPWYDFAVRCPTAQIGRVITDIRAMAGIFDAPETVGGDSVLKGKVPASQVRDYADTLAAFTQGRGQLQLTLRGYEPCHTPEEVIAAAGYDPEADLANTPDSVFCAHGAGFNVKWNQVPEYMHLESGRKERREPELITRNLTPADDRELEKIMEREFGPIRRPQYGVSSRNIPATAEVTIRPPREKYILVDGYNVLFAWEELAQTAKSDLDAARRRLCDHLANYASLRGCRMVVVFDGYARPGNPGEKERLSGLQIVYTRERETADRYLEELADRIGTSYAVYVASSDSLVQLSSFRSGILRLSARELKEEVEAAEAEMRKNLGKS